MMISYSLQNKIKTLWFRIEIHSPHIAYSRQTEDKIFYPDLYTTSRSCPLCHNTETIMHTLCYVITQDSDMITLVVETINKHSESNQTDNHIISQFNRSNLFALSITEESPFYLMIRQLIQIVFYFLFFFLLFPYISHWASNLT